MKSVTAQALRRLGTVVPRGELRLDEPTRRAHSGDKWFASCLPDAVVLARSTRTVSRVLAYATRHGIPVTARGAGYGYVGGCVPARGGIVLSLARMNRILDISAADFVAEVEAGVITQALQEAVEAKGLYYPPDPASRADCTLGGNIATNAGGPRCLKYGVTRDYVLGLQVVLADGRVLELGGRTHKNKTGFELGRLFVGSEGLLGVVTRATLKLLPKPPFRACLGVGFDSMAAAVRAIAAIFAAGILPSALEIADRFTLEAAIRRTRSPLLKGCEAHFIVELDGQEGSVRQEIRSLARLIRSHRPRTFRAGYADEGCERFWGLRREFSYSLRDTGLTKLNEDIVVPRGRLLELFRLTERLQRRHRLQIASFGHVGDGNIHVNVMVDQADAAAMRRSERALDDLFKGVLALGGAITGEHGIGLAKGRWWPLAVSPEVRAAHAAVKQAFDPAGILNPGKFV